MDGTRLAIKWRQEEKPMSAIHQRTIQTASGKPVVVPRMKVPRPNLSLSDLLAAVIAKRWAEGDYGHIVAGIIDAICEHIRKSSHDVTAMDQRLADAIEDYMSTDPIEGDTDQQQECGDEEGQQKLWAIL
jgi:hypothetical protein